jgi:hypothetical protein
MPGVYGHSHCPIVSHMQPPVYLEDGEKEEEREEEEEEEETEDAEEEDVEENRP